MRPPKSFSASSMASFLLGLGMDRPSNTSAALDKENKMTMVSVAIFLIMILDRKK